MKYKLLYVDPPWKFAVWSDLGKGRSPEAHYDCMSLEELENFPLGDYAEENSFILMWTTDPMIPYSLRVMRRWGFEYRGLAFLWLKLNKKIELGNTTNRYAGLFTGLGYWTRANPEPCILGVRGSPETKSGSSPDPVVLCSERREHSRKPDECYELIEKNFYGPYLEVFARTERPGWDAIGNEKTLFKEGEKVSTRRWPSNLKGGPTRCSSS